MKSSGLFSFHGIFLFPLRGEQMEGLEFDVYAARPQTSLELKGSGGVRLSVTGHGYFWRKEELKEISNK